MRAVWADSECRREKTLEIVFKSNLKRLPDTELTDAIAAHINTSCGELYSDVEDDDTLTGVHKTQSNATRLSTLMANKTVPHTSKGVSISAKHKRL